MSIEFTTAECVGVCEGAFLSNASDGLLALFGPPDASKGTRVLKDVLKVGKWKVGHNADGSPILGNFSAEVLKSIVDNFKLAKSRGFAFNLGNGHGDKSTGLIAAPDLIAPIDDLAFDGTTLWMSSYVDAEQHKYLSNNARKVSIGLQGGWIDGAGNKYPISIKHVAVTDNPIVPGQGGFITLANVQAGNFSTLKGYFNKLLKMLNFGTLPESVDEGNIAVVLEAVIKSQNPDSEEDEQPISSKESTMPDASLANVEIQGLRDEFVKLSNEVIELRKTADAVELLTAKLAASESQVATLSNSIAEVKSEKEKERYEGRVLALCQLGKVTPDTANLLKKIGEKDSWNLSNIESYEKLAPGTAVNLSSVAKTFALPDAPAVVGVTVEMTDKEAEELAATL